MAPQRPRVPGMPLFEPSHDSAARRAFSQFEVLAEVEGCKEFQFPATEMFWDNFVTQAALSPEAMRSPTLEVSASHKSGVSMQVNNKWMLQFCGAWGKQYPHNVTIRTSTGTELFCASEEFWNRARAAGSDAAYSGVDTVEIISDRMPMPIRTSAVQWSRLCDDWEKEKKCGGEQRRHILQQRQLQAVQLQDQLQEQAAALDHADGFRSDRLPDRGRRRLQPLCIEVAESSSDSGGEAARRPGAPPSEARPGALMTKPPPEVPSTRSPARPARNPIQEKAEEEVCIRDLRGEVDCGLDFAPGQGLLVAGLRDGGAAWREGAQHVVGMRLAMADGVGVDEPRDLALIVSKLVDGHSKRRLHLTFIPGDEARSPCNASPPAPPRPPPDPVVPQVTLTSPDDSEDAASRRDRQPPRATSDLVSSVTAAVLRQLGAAGAGPHLPGGAPEGQLQSVVSSSAAAATGQQRVASLSTISSRQLQQQQRVGLPALGTVELRTPSSTARQPGAAQPHRPGGCAPETHSTNPTEVAEQTTVNRWLQVRAQLTPYSAEAEELVAAVTGALEAEDSTGISEPLMAVGDAETWALSRRLWHYSTGCSLRADVLARLPRAARALTASSLREAGLEPAAQGEMQPPVLLGLCVRIAADSEEVRELCLEHGVAWGPRKAAICGLPGLVAEEDDEGHVQVVFGDGRSAWFPPAALRLRLRCTRDADLLRRTLVRQGGNGGLGPLEADALAGRESLVHWPTCAELQQTPAPPYSSIGPAAQWQCSVRLAGGEEVAVDLPLHVLRPLPAGAAMGGVGGDGSSGRGHDGSVVNELHSSAPRRAATRPGSHAAPALSPGSGSPQPAALSPSPARHRLRCGVLADCVVSLAAACGAICRQPIRCPGMPLFRPSEVAADAQLLAAERQAVLAASEEGDPPAVPASPKELRRDLYQEAPLCSAARSAADTDGSSPRFATEGIDELWAAAFSSAWLQRYPRRLALRRSGGGLSESCPASDEFWRSVAAPLGVPYSPSERLPPDGALVVESSPWRGQADAPACEAVVFSEKDWEAAVSEWEARRRCRPADLQEQLAQRQRAGSGARRMEQWSIQPPRDPPVSRSLLARPPQRRDPARGAVTQVEEAGPEGGVVQEEPTLRDVISEMRRLGNAQHRRQQEAAQEQGGARALPVLPSGPTALVCALPQEYVVSAPTQFAVAGRYVLTAHLRWECPPLLTLCLASDGRWQVARGQADDRQEPEQVLRSVAPCYGLPPHAVRWAAPAGAGWAHSSALSVLPAAAADGASSSLGGERSAQHAAPLHWPDPEEMVQQLASPDTVPAPTRPRAIASSGGVIESPQPRSSPTRRSPRQQRAAPARATAAPAAPRVNGGSTAAASVAIADGIITPATATPQLPGRRRPAGPAARSVSPPVTPRGRRSRAGSSAVPSPPLLTLVVPQQRCPTPLSSPHSASTAPRSPGQRSDEAAPTPRRFRIARAPSFSAGAPGGAPDGPAAGGSAPRRWRRPSTDKLAALAGVSRLQQCTAVGDAPSVATASRRPSVHSSASARCP
eukprot:TRINITY_DN10548_c0_g1_i1.p1 TRINITY_DN10548_c0_g1~~TRINITY_DN10548_c0_g1_i1.p1  ORF type:complete len:1570 (+),score=383.28 TRINITY_DN10548_c0_g1_i1:85-4710(+)